MTFQGSIVALVTPFDKNGAIEESCLRDLIAWHIAEGTHGIVACGTTGESPTLTHNEHKKVVELCIKYANKQIPVMAGVGSNATAEAIDFTRHATEAGAEAGLVVTPYYNKPSQAGLLAHYRAIAESAPDLPLYIYNIPPRSVIDMAVPTMAELSKVPNIVGVKDASCDLARVEQQRDSCGTDFIQLSGEDPTALPFMQKGGRGCISVSANVAPRLCAEFQNACLAQDYDTAKALDAQLQPLHKALFLDSSPAPTKFALAQLGKCPNTLRLPLVQANETAQNALLKTLQALGLEK